MIDDKYLPDLIESLRGAIVRCPDHKITNINQDEKKRNSDFAVFILSYGRADNPKTWKTLMNEKRIYNQDTYFICSDDDKQLDEYIENFGDKVLVFNKEKTMPYMDAGDNFQKTNVVLWARNVCFAFAKQLGYRFFVEFDDDYDVFSQRIFYDNEKLMIKYITDYDRMLQIHIDFLKNTPTRCVTFAQHGDFIGGAGNGNAQRGWQRKVMNSFFCDMEKPFFFDGTMNDDVNYYVQSGRRGVLNFNLFGFSLNQEQTQASAGGLTDAYLEGGTYLKSIYATLFEPSSAKIGYIGHGDNKRMHHKINANFTYPLILDEKYAKNTYEELNSVPSDMDDF